MLLRFVSWNLNGFVRGGQSELLATTAWDVCAVQEVTSEEAFAALAEGASARGVTARPCLPADNEPPYVCGLLAREPWKLVDRGVLDAAPSPERALHAAAAAGDHRVAVASMALPPASIRAWGPAKKVQQALDIGGWLAAQPGPTVLGIDANTPRWDRLDLAETDFWNDGEEHLLGPAPMHRLRDVFRETVERDPARLAAIAAERPDGPLAVSHVRGTGDRRVECRYDFVLASPEIRVIDAGYCWEEAREAKSDHALVWAQLELS